MLLLLFYNLFPFPLLYLRDADANAAVDRARKFQREASDLRRRLETSSSIVGNNSSRGVTPAGGGRGEENTMRSSAVAGGGVGRGGGGGSGGGGGGGDYVDQQQQQRGLKSEVERLKLELQGQREACVAVTSEGDELKAAVREVGAVPRLRTVYDTAVVRNLLFLSRFFLYCSTLLKRNIEQLVRSNPVIPYRTFYGGDHRC